MPYCGGDGSSDFIDVGHSNDAVSMAKDYVIGKVKRSSSGTSASGTPHAEKLRRKHGRMCFCASASLTTLVIAAFVAYRYFYRRSVS